MDFTELVQKRYSVRAYRSDPVEKDKLDHVLAIACLAPTAANRQPFRIVVAHTEGKNDKFRSVYDRDWFVQAPLIICICGVPAESWVRYDGKSYLDVDVAIVMDHLILVATEVGLGTCWIASFDVESAREVFRIPKEFEPIVLTPLGYAADSPKPKLRKELSEIVHFEQW